MANGKCILRISTIIGKYGGIRHRYGSFNGLLCSGKAINELYPINIVSTGFETRLNAGF